MKQLNIKFLLALLISMLGVKASAHDIEVKNVDGVSIYYYYVSSTELAVCYRGSNVTLYDNEYMGNVVIPETVIYNGVTYSVTCIGENAFYNCSGLTSITIPNSITSIGNYAFEGCSGLTSIIIPNSVASIGYGVFEYCRGLTSITIPNSVTSIGDGAFSRCSSLTSITIPNSVTSIGEGAFYECSSLSSIAIPNSVTNIGASAFYGTAWYDNQPDGVVYAGKVAYKYKGTMPSNTNVVLDEGTLGISSSAFSGCSGLTSITIPNSVTNIGDNAFNKTGWYNNQPDGLVYAGKVAYKYKGTMPSNTNTVLNEGTLGISSSAFSGCSGLTSIIIPNSVTNIGSEAFRECTSLTNVTIGNSVTSIGDLTFALCIGLTTITIPNSVATIGNSTFYGCSGLTSIAIGNSVTSIGEAAFTRCSGLTNIAIPNSVTIIGRGAFQDCSSLSSIDIPNSVTSIGTSAFNGCSGLTSITIGNSVTSIGYYAFQDCSGLTEVHISDLAAWCNIMFNNDHYVNPLYYAKHLFLNGEEITELNIPNSVTCIGNSTFEYCSSLTSITIPNSVTSIGDYAFRGCSGVTNVSIGSSVTSIGLQAFQNCDNLLTVKSEIEEPFNCSGRFSTNTLRNGTLYIPAGTKDLYTRFDGWREFLKIEEVGGEQEQYVWLTIKDGRGSTMLKVKKGAVQELAVKPEAGWKILMATMDGTDISAQIKNSNVYTTPAIMNDATINIIYEMDDPSGTVTARQSKADIKVVDDGVVISNAEPQSRCVVYSSSGQQVVNTVIEDGSRKITLQKGQVYILTINGRTLKFAL